MDGFVSPLALYSVLAVVASVVTFAAGRRFRVDTGAGSATLVALVVGLIWPIALVGLLQLGIVHAAARWLRYIDGLVDPRAVPEEVALGPAILAAR